MYQGIRPEVGNASENAIQPGAQGHFGDMALRLFSDERESVGLHTDQSRAGISLAVAQRNRGTFRPPSSSPGLPGWSHRPIHPVCQGEEPGFNMAHPRTGRVATRHGLRVLRLHEFCLNSRPRTPARRDRPYFQTFRVVVAATCPGRRPSPPGVDPRCDRIQNARRVVPDGCDRRSPSTVRKRNRCGKRPATVGPSQRGSNRCRTAPAKVR